MDNFTFYNPVKILFGKGQIANITQELPVDAKILLTFGSGSIKKNGVYQQVLASLKNFSIVEFGGIEPNPQFDTVMKAVELGRKEKVNFILAVGGGSVLDGSKFIAAAIPFQGDPWGIVTKHHKVMEAIPLASILTLPATGSEVNSFAVISNKQTQQKMGFGSPLLYPRFSVLDPETTFSLPPRQIGNGVVDAFTHVMEQYLTYPVNAPLQDAMAEGILRTLINEGPKTLAHPREYETRANIMWAASMALNGLIGVGVPHDWSTHMIGHEITVLYNLDHAQTLAILLPAVMTVQAQQKREKILQYGANIWHINSGDTGQRIEGAIIKTREFFESMGVPTRFSSYGIMKPDIKLIVQRLTDKGMVTLGEHGNITPEVVCKILNISI